MQWQQCIDRSSICFRRYVFLDTGNGIKFNDKFKSDGESISNDNLHTDRNNNSNRMQ